MNLGPTSHHISKLIQMDQKPKLRVKTVKVLEENVGINT